MNDRSAVGDVLWRDELLQALYWLTQEGLAREVGAGDLVRLLDAAEPELERQLRRLVRRGDLEPVPGVPARYRLTETGRREGGRRFADEFADLVHRGHFECADDCWCHDPEHAGEPCPSHGHAAGRPAPAAGGASSP